jgi:hypothetical protein
LRDSSSRDFRARDAWYSIRLLPLAATGLKLSMMTSAIIAFVYLLLIRSDRPRTTPRHACPPRFFPFRILRPASTAHDPPVLNPLSV